MPILLTILGPERAVFSADRWNGVVAAEAGWRFLEKTSRSSLKKKRASLDIARDLESEGIASLKLRFVEPNFEPGGVESRFEPLRRLDVFAGVTDEDRAARRLGRERRRRGLEKRRAMLGPTPPEFVDKLHCATIVTLGLLAKVAKKDLI